jgi:hypothetical protein
MSEAKPAGRKETTKMVRRVPSTPWVMNSQWGAILAGTLAGFAAIVLMSTLGAALGSTAGAIMLDEPRTEDTTEKATAAFSVGFVFWVILTALVGGLVGGYVVARASNYDRPYRPMMLGAISWAGGIVLALALLAPGTGGLLGGLGGSAAGTAGLRYDGTYGRFERVPSGVESRPMTPAEREEMRQTAGVATRSAATGAWILLTALLVGLASTMLAANRYQLVETVESPETVPGETAPAPSGI